MGEDLGKGCFRETFCCFAFYLPFERTKQSVWAMARTTLFSITLGHCKVFLEGLINAKGRMKNPRAGLQLDNPRGVMRNLEGLGRRDAFPLSLLGLAGFSLRRLSPPPKHMWISFH